MIKTLTILSHYRRPHLHKHQVERVLAQTARSPEDEIWCWVNDNTELKRHPKVHYIISDQNHKFHARFLLAYLTDADYISILDDDQIPGQDWYKNCKNSLMSNYNMVLGGIGVILPPTGYRPMQRFGHVNPQEKLIVVDFVGQSWFFPRKHIHYLLADSPHTFDNGEDIQFGYVCQKNGVIHAVPPHPKDKTDMWSCLPKYRNEGANPRSAHSITNKNHYYDRANIVEYYKYLGWRILDDGIV